VIFGFAETRGGVVPGPVIGGFFDRAVLYGDGTLLVSDGSDPASSGVHFERISLTGTGVQRVLRNVIVDGRMFSQRGLVPDAVIVCADCGTPRIEVNTGEHRRAVEFTWWAGGSEPDGLSARAQGLVEWAEALGEASFEADEVLRVEPYVPPGVFLRLFEWPPDSGNPQRWPAELPPAVSLADGKEHLLCDASAAKLVDVLDSGRAPILADGGADWWVSARPALPHEWDPALCE
jgi:hypothetical protein